MNDPAMIPGLALQESHSIGCHIHKEKTLTATVRGVASLSHRPYQVFLGSPQSTTLNIKDEDLAGAGAAQAETAVRLYVHSPYVINLCHEPGKNQDYGVSCLIKNLQYAVATGLRGVVVHVGKSTDLPLETAMAHMRTNLVKAMEHATPECPLLLETPAGQGTEMLTTYDSFVDLVRSINSPNLRICVDTCHVFAAGGQPLDYIQRLNSTDPTLLKLVHFNDSSTPCGSRKDRHAYIGTGHIGFPAMKEIADYCKTARIPMLVE